MSSPNPHEGLSEFFDIIWGADTGLVYIPVKDPNNAWEQAFFRWPVSREHIISHILTQDAIGKEVYFSPVLWEKNTIEKSSVKSSKVVWADFDGNAPQDWPEHPVDNQVGQPSIIIQSSIDTRQHVYWRLDEPCTDMDWLENTNRSITYAYHADSSGWDFSQILRPPFTTNHKRKLPVLVASIDDVKYSASSFKTFSPVKQLVSNSVDEESLPNPIEVIGKYTWSTEDLNLLQKSEFSGDRSAALMRIAYRCAEVGATDAEAYSVLLHLDSSLRKFVGRNDSKKRLLDLINRARQKFPHAIESPTFAGLTKAIEVPQDIQYFYGFSSFVKADFHVDWIIEELMPLQGCGVIVSPPGVGKTQIMTQMGLRNAIRKPFIGYNFVDELRTLFFHLEMPRAGVHKFYSDMHRGYSDVELRQLDSKFIVGAIGQSIPLNVPEGRKFFEDAIETHQPHIIIIDSFQKVLSGSVNDDEAVRTLFNYIASIRAKYGVCVWFIHHNRKSQGDNKKPKELDDVYGSRFITSEPDVVLSVWSEKQTRNVIEVSELKNRYAEAKDDFIIERVANLSFERQLQGLMNAATSMDTSVPLGTVPNRPTLNGIINRRKPGAFS